MNKRWKNVLSGLMFAFVLCALVLTAVNYFEPGLLSIGGMLLAPETVEDKQVDNLKNIFLEIDEWLMPVIWTVLGFSSLYAIFLGVMLAKAEGADQREQAKKRMRNFLIGIVTVVLLMALLKVVTSNIDAVLNFIGYGNSVEKK